MQLPRLRAIAALSACVMLHAATSLIAAGALQAQIPLDSLLRKAIASQERPRRQLSFPALEWQARAVVHLPGRDIVLHGVWKVQPPDSAIVATFDTTRGPASTQRMILAGHRGWLQRDSQLTAMPPDMLTEERHQFYLYSLLQLTPLQRPGVRLRAVPPDAAGNSGFRVQQHGRLPVTMYFDHTGRVSHMATTFATLGRTAEDAQDILLSGTRDVEGITWFRQMTITRNGKPYFEMEITKLHAVPRISDSLFARLARPH
jgi:hypothetical protein